MKNSLRNSHTHKGSNSDVDVFSQWIKNKNSVKRGEKWKQNLDINFYNLFSCSILFPLAIQFIYYTLFFTVNKNLNFGKRQRIQTNCNNREWKTHKNNSLFNGLISKDAPKSIEKKSSKLISQQRNLFFFHSFLDECNVVQLPCKALGLV